MTEYFTSDHHFLHKNVLEFEDRPFNSIEEMEEGLIDIWNQTVSDNDIVHYLGDFSLGNQKKSIEIARRLNGKIIVYKGNHDEHNKLKKMRQEGVIEEYHMVGSYIKRHKKVLYLTHYPLELGNRPNLYSIHGHIHSYPSKMLNQINVGVDSPLNFDREFGKPVSLEEVVEYISYTEPHIKELWKQEREQSNR